jgi:hypothetical protein
MPSKAMTTHFFELLGDADNLVVVLDGLASQAADQSMIDCLSRSIIVSCVSAWEAYMEELVRESIELLKPAGTALGPWPVFRAASLVYVGRFNTPNTDQVRNLLAESLGLQDIQQFWEWPGTTRSESRTRLHQIMELRHQIAHGTRPRPIIPSHIASDTRVFFTQLARATDDALLTYLTACGVPSPWPVP